MIVEPLEMIVTTAYPGERLGLAPEPIAAAEARLGVALPEPLKDFYGVAGGSRDLLNADYRFLPPEKLRIDDDHLIFCGENQGLEGFGIPLEALKAGKPNPAVHVRPTQGGRWTSEASALTAFLLGMTAWQVALALPEKARCPYPETELKKLLPTFEAVGAPKVRLGGHRTALVARSRSVVAAYVHITEMLYLGSPREEALEELEQTLGLDFDSL